MNTADESPKRSHRIAHVAASMFFSPTFLIAAAAPGLMHAITNSAVASAVAKKDDLMLSFLNATTHGGSYACQWFDVKMQFYVLIVGMTIACAEFVSLLINMSYLRHQTLKDSFPYLVAGLMYFSAFAIVMLIMLGSRYIGPDLAVQYSETCANPLKTPPWNFVTVMRLTLIVPIILIFKMKSKFNAV